MPYTKEHKNIDTSSMQFSFEGPLQLIYTDIADIKFFAQSVVAPKYCLLAVNLFLSEIDIYQRKNRSLLKRITIIS